jgi:hypothetical protein
MDRWGVKCVYYVKKIGYVVGSGTHRNLSFQRYQINYISKRWKIWCAIITPGTRYYCASMNGRILSVDDERILDIPVHPNCKCYIDTVQAIAAGTATDAGANGVDLYVALHGTLPDNYITQADAKKLGWKKLLGNLAEVLPGKIIGGDVYKNYDHRLPEATGRIWYEADLDYVRGFRNSHRLLYSNDGLIFVTYDHYLTFSEIGLDAIKLEGRS